MSTASTSSTDANPEPPLWLALIPVVALVSFLGISLGLLKFEDPHLALLLGSAVAATAARSQRQSWDAIIDGMARGIAVGLPAILILLVIGMIIGLWVAAGIVPLLIDWGLSLLSPGWFLAAACLICAVVSLVTGSSWTTAGTVGVALVGVGTGLGVPLPMTAGAIISGAYFGDKMSPLSDTTNLAPAVAGSELFEHIRHMMWTSVPSILLTLLLFSLLGLGQNFTISTSVGGLEALQSALREHYHLTPWLLLAPAVVVILVVRRVPALPALFLGALAGAVTAMVFQGLSLTAVLDAAMNGYQGTTGFETADTLLTGGGLSSMYWTITLILCALAFGGVMEAAGFLRSLAGAILRLARGTGSLVATTAATCLGMNALAPDQYLAIVVPGRMYRTAFDRLNLHPKNLSRVLEDAGTLTSPLILWNTCGATMMEVLGVSALLYWKFCFFNLINPVLSVVYGFTNFTMGKRESGGG